MKMIKKGIIVGININNKNNFDESMEELNYCELKVDNCPLFLFCIIIFKEIFYIKHIKSFFY